MSVVYHERPGVYSDYDTSSTTASSGRAAVVAVAAVSDAKAGLYTVTTLAAGSATFGADSQMTQLLKLLYQNGAGTVLAYPVAEDTAESYETAFAALLEPKTAGYLICGSGLAAVHSAMRAAVIKSSDERGECIGLVGLSGEPDSTALLERAASLNCERMILVGPGCYAAGATESGGGILGAAALAGVIAAQTDPAVPFNGVALAGLDGVTALYEDTALDALIRGGVTVLESVSGQVCVVRGITTRTTTGEAADTTWRELNTILIADNVIPAIRSTLKAKFLRAKNNAATRSAIRSQVIVELEDRVTREIIESYDDVTATADSTDPTVCLVEFGFTVVHGLSRIYLTAHIAV
jgi:hypothetical protein